MYCTSVTIPLMSSDVTVYNSVYCIYSSIQDGSFIIPDLMKLSQSKILVTTLVTARLLFLMGLPRGHFTHIFVDEAAQVHVIAYSK